MTPIVNSAGRSLWRLHDSLVSTGAIGALAYILADIVHEVIGHGGACLAVGGKIVLLTSVFFRCSPLGIRIVDAGGPLANLAAAVLLWGALQRRRDGDPKIRLFLALAATFNGLWGAGQMAYSAVLDNDDWAFALRGLLPPLLWRPGLILLGGALYYCVIVALAKEMARFTAAGTLPARRRAYSLLLISYAASGLVACLAAALYAPDPLGAMREGALETLAANCGMLLLWRRLQERPPDLTPAAAITFDGRWIASALGASVLFAAILGRGL